MGQSAKDSRLAEAEIIPTVIDDFKPIFGLTVAWKSDVARLGNTLKPSHLASGPSVHLEKAKSPSDSQFQPTADMTYVLVLTDPDAPSRDNPKWSQFCHWIATGIQISTSEVSDIQIEDVVKYRPPGPPPKTGKHRYVFLALVAANGTTDKLILAKPKDRKHWGSDQEGYGVREWANKHGLMAVGGLSWLLSCKEHRLTFLTNLGANFIYAENEKQ